MKLTRRGRTVAVLLVVSFLWGSVFGIQAMNALVVSGLIALCGSWFIVRRAAEPTIRRTPVSADFVGRSREIEIAVDAPPSLGTTLVETIPEHVRVVDGDSNRPVTGRHVTYDVVADRRGAHTLGPAHIAVTDPLGLVERRTFATMTESLLTYPAVIPLAPVHPGYDSPLQGMPTRNRHEFDQLREYQRGDAVRDIDWKSSAKRAADPLVVKEFVSDVDEGNAEIVAVSNEDTANEMATAAASIAEHLLDRGIAVGLRTNDERVPIDTGTKQRHEILAALARTTGGPVDALHREKGIILIDAESDEVNVSVGGGAHSFAQLTDRDANVAVADGGWER